MPGEIVLRVLAHVWSHLSRLQLPVAVMGGIALAAWKHIRATQDVDLLVQLSPTDPDALVRELERIGLRPKLVPPVLVIGAYRIMQFLYEPPGTYVEVQVDLLLADSAYQQQALTRRQPAKLPDSEVEIFVLSCEDLLLHKLIAGRILDRLDVIALLRANRLTLDLPYLQTWIGPLALTAEWSVAWREAFPGEEPPSGT